jgi:transposase
MARFRVLPGADHLLRAFAAIPPGKLRDTIIDHAQALAEAHGAVPAQHRHPDPLAGFLGAPGRPPALPRRTEAEPPTSDPKTKAVQMRLDGKLPYEIAEATGLKISTVYGAITDARKAGMKFPTTPRAPAGKGNRASRFPLTVEQLGDGAKVATSARAAEARGITLQEYMDRRKLAVEMALDGRHIRAIMEQTKESKSVLTTWFSAARSAGYPVPYMLDAAIGRFEDANVTPPEKVVDIGSERQRRESKRKPGKTGLQKNFILSEAEANPKNLYMVDKAAAALGLSREAYFNLRRKALILFHDGETASTVATRLGIDKKQAQNWRERAISSGLLKRA